jgi:hypothetical protein
MFWAAVVNAPFAVTKLTTVWLFCFATVTGIGAESLAANVPSPP